MAAERRYPQESYYDLLGVASSAGRGEIRSAYLRMKDEARSSRLGPSVSSEMLDEAYEILLDQAQRTAYDAYLSQRNAPTEPEQPPVRPRSQPPRTAKTLVDLALESYGEVATILHGTINNLHDKTDVGYARSEAVAPSLPAGEREEICRELRMKLGVHQSPVLVFTRMADKGLRSYSSPEGIGGWIMAHFLPLRSLDGVRYRELTFAVKENDRIVWVERRGLSQGGQPGRLLSAFVVVSGEESGALQRGHPSPSLRNWFSGQRW